MKIREYRVTLYPNQIAASSRPASPQVYRVRGRAALRKLVAEKTGAVKVARFVECGKLLAWRDPNDRALEVRVEDVTSHFV